MISISPPPLYKYLSLALAQTPPWQDRLMMLLHGNCYLSSAADFNDPFDCLPYIDVPTAQPDLWAWKQGMARRIADAMAGDFPAWFIQAQAQTALDDLPIPLLREKLQQAAAANAREKGVFCLAETINNVLMWSHYAANHYGIALQFDFQRGNAEQLLPIWKVDYQPVRPVIADMHTTIQERPLADALATKADFWHYEQEWRVMKADKAGTIIPFDRSIITGIALGAKCTAENEKLIRKMIGDSVVTLHRMRVSDRTFNLTMAAL